MINKKDLLMMQVTKRMSLLSDDPNTKVGCLICDEKYHVIGLGFNKFPDRCEKRIFSWRREGKFLNTKYPYVIHAEAVAILDCIEKKKKPKFLFTTLFPCNECAKLIVQSGIKKVFYLEDKYADTDSVIASKRLLLWSGIKYTQINAKDLNTRIG